MTGLDSDIDAGDPLDFSEVARATPPLRFEPGSQVGQNLQCLDPEFILYQTKANKNNVLKIASIGFIFLVEAI